MGVDPTANRLYPGLSNSPLKHMKISMQIWTVSAAFPGVVTIVPSYE